VWLDCSCGAQLVRRGIPATEGKRDRADRRTPNPSRRRRRKHSECRWVKLFSPCTTKQRSEWRLPASGEELPVLQQTVAASEACLRGHPADSRTALGRHGSPPSSGRRIAGRRSAASLLDLKQDRLSRTTALAVENRRSLPPCYPTETLGRTPPTRRNPQPRNGVVFGGRPGAPQVSAAVTPLAATGPRSNTQALRDALASEPHQQPREAYQ
jgi:hypothetical protein